MSKLSLVSFALATVLSAGAAYAQAGALTLQLNVNQARLQVGMPSSVVQQSLQNDQAVDIITYCNQVSAAAKARRRASSPTRSAS